MATTPSNAATQTSGYTPKTLTGARCVVVLDGTAIGTFDSISYGESVGTEAIHTLGSYMAREIVPTSYESITVNCSGYRVINSGPHTTPKFPSVTDLLSINSVNLEVYDRQTNTVVGVIYGCIPSNNQVGFHAKSTSKMSISYHGIWASDESLPNGQAEAGAPSWP